MSVVGLVPQPPYPWLRDAWSTFVKRVENNRLPHALLLVGPDGVGVGELARAMAQYLLCVAPQTGHLCGRCKACLLMKADSHPDLHQLTVAEKSSSIKVDQVRAMSEFVAKTPQQGGRKLVLIQPAEAMNANAANALLKNLEEPSGDSVLILVSEQPAFILATIRSRCSRLTIPLPSQVNAIAWLERNQVSDARALLEEAGGRPLRVLEWLEKDIWGQRAALEQELVNLLSHRSLFLDCSKAIVGFGAVWVIEQLQGWISRAIPKTMAGLEEKHGDGIVKNLQQLPVKPLFELYDQLLQRKRQLLSGANPNPQLVLDEILMVLKDLAVKNS